MGNTYLRVVELAKKEHGESSGGKYLDRESWFWNSELQETVDQKKNAFKEWQRVKDRPETDLEEAKERDYREKNITPKAKVATAKEKAKTMIRRSQDKDSEGKILCEDNDIKKRWRENFDKFLNTKYRRKDLDRIDRVEGSARLISEVESKGWKDEE